MAEPMTRALKTARTDPSNSGNGGPKLSNGMTKGHHEAAISMKRIDHRGTKGHLEVPHTAKRERSQPHVRVAKGPSPLEAESGVLDPATLTQKAAAAYAKRHNGALPGMTPGQPAAFPEQQQDNPFNSSLAPTLTNKATLGIGEHRSYFLQTPYSNSSTTIADHSVDQRWTRARRGIRLTVPLSVAFSDSTQVEDVQEPYGVSRVNKERFKNRIKFLSLVISAGLLATIIFLVTIFLGHPTEFPPSAPHLRPQGSPEHRSTAEISFACLSTMIICVVTALHFDLPINTAHRLSLIKRLRSTSHWRAVAFKLITWSLGLLAPECIVFWSWSEFTSARRDVHLMRGNNYPQWTHRHAFFARMGGIELEGYGVISSGVKLLQVVDQTGNRLVDEVDFTRMLNDIDDKSKADIIAKLLAIVQICRFLAQMVARRVQALPNSPLEYVTCAYVVCALMVYTFWFRKPYNVEERIVLRSSPAYAKQTEGRMPYPVTRLWRIPENIPDANDSGSISDPWALLVTLLAALILGAGHMASWNARFPTNHGQLVWRICSIFIMAAPAVTYIGMVFLNWTRTWSCIVVVALAYLVARFTLLFLLGYSFYSLPAGVYDTEHVRWLSFLPFFH